jgi:hypothetical protein
MADENFDPTTQDQNTQAQQAVPQTVPIERFNEVYAQSKEMERRYQEMIERQNTLLADIATRSAPPVKEDDPFEDMDPDEAVRLRRITEALTRPLMQKVGQLEGQLARNTGQQRFQQLAQHVGDPAVLQRAEELKAAWEKRGLHGWTEEDAFKYAAGELAVADKLKAAPARNERDQFNYMGAPITAQGGSRGAPPTRRVDVESLPLDQQIEYWEKELDGKTF